MGKPSRWRKLGHIFTPSGVHEKLRTHAANPLAVPMEDGLYRIFFSGRDAKSRSSVGFFDFDIQRRCVVRECDSPAFEYGPPDSFYSHGVSIGCVYSAGGRRFMPFMGWHIPDNGHWRGEVGRLIVADDLSLQLAETDPLLGFSPEDPISLSYPWIEQAPDGRFRMCYGSTLTWDAGNGEMLHVLNHATSNDGHMWSRLGLAVPFQLGTVQAFSRPTMLPEASGGYRMWFSYRSGAGTPYRIGSAFSRDGEAWALRLDETGIDVSESGWDSQMIEYPFVFRDGDAVYMLYNGNDYGKTGIGLAVLET